MALSVEMLESELDRGRTLRADGFFDTSTDGRSDAEEVMEGLLRKAQTEYEERKLKYLARLWANACLDETLGAAKLNYLVKLAEQLTYRQFTVISIAGAMAKADNANIYHLREQHYENTELNMLAETAIVLSEIMALHNLNWRQCGRAPGTGSNHAVRNENRHPWRNVVQTPWSFTGFPEVTVNR